MVTRMALIRSWKQVPSRILRLLGKMPRQASQASSVVLMLAGLTACDPVVSVRTRAHGLGPLSEECVGRAVTIVLPGASLTRTEHPGRVAVVLEDGALAVDLKEPSTGEARGVSNWLRKPGMGRVARYEKLQRDILNACAAACFPGR